MEPRRLGFTLCLLSLLAGTSAFAQPLSVALSVDRAPAVELPVVELPSAGLPSANFLSIAPQPVLTERERINQALKAGDHALSERLLAAYLEQSPQDAELRFKYAQVLSWQSQHEAALVQYDQLLANAPDDVDVLLGKAQTLVWSNNTDEALSLLQRAQALAPDYEAIWQLMVTVMVKMDQATDAATLEALLDDARARFPDTDWQTLLPKATLAVELTETRAVETTTIEPSEPVVLDWVEAGLDFDNLSGGRSSWRERYVALGVTWLDALHGNDVTLPGSNDLDAYLRYRETERFRINDYSLALGLSSHPDKDWWFDGEFDISPSYRVLPKNSLTLHATKAFSQGYNGQITYRQRLYTDTDTQSISLTIERYFLAYQAYYTFTPTTIAGAGSANTHGVGFIWHYQEDSYTGLHANVGEELEYTGTSTPGVYSINGLRIAGRHLFAPMWSFIYSLGYHQQGNLYIRNGIHAAINRRF